MEKYKELVQKYVHILNVEGFEENDNSETKDVTTFAKEIRKVSFEEILQIVIEDVPHQYQERLLSLLTLNTQ